MDINQYYTAQVGLIGSLLIDSRAIAGDVMRTVSAEDMTSFYRTMFEACQRLFTAMRPIDPVTLLDELGGAREEYSKKLVEIMDLTPTAANWKAYADIIRSDAQLRRFQDTANDIVSAVSLDEARSAAERLSRLLADRPQLRIVPFAQGFAEFLQRQGGGEAPKYLHWGYPALDERLYVEDGDFLILGGYPSSGKTILAMQFAYRMAANGLRVGVFSLETRDRKLYDRLFSHIARVPFEKVKKRGIDRNELNGILEEMAPIADKTSLEVCHVAGMSVADIQAVSLSRGYDVIFIDYLQLLAGEGFSRYEQVTKISVDLHTMAGITGITVIALSQLSRRNKQVKSNLPTMADLRESGQLEQDADIVMLLSLEDEEVSDGDRILQIAKNKEGERGRLRLAFDPEHISLNFKREYSYKTPPRVSRFKETQEAIPEEWHKTAQTKIGGMDDTGKSN